MLVRRLVVFDSLFGLPVRVILPKHILTDVNVQTYGSVITLEASAPVPIQGGMFCLLSGKFSNAEKDSKTSSETIKEPLGI